MKTVILDTCTVTKGDIDMTALERFGEIEYFDILSKDQIIKVLQGADAVVCNKAVIDKDKDVRGGFSFTASGYRDLFRFLGKANSKEWFKKYPKSLPTLVISGEDDPVGGFGKGVSYVYKKLLISGAENVELKLYEGARHELYNEINADEIFRDLLLWLEK